MNNRAPLGCSLSANAPSPVATACTALRRRHRRPHLARPAADVFAARLSSGRSTRSGRADVARRRRLSSDRSPTGEPRSKRRLPRPERSPRELSTGISDMDHVRFPIALRSRPRDARHRVLFIRERDAVGRSCGDRAVDRACSVEARPLLTGHLRDTPARVAWLLPSGANARSGWAARQPRDACNDLPEQNPCQVAFGELQGEVAGMSDQAPAGLEEPLLQNRQGPTPDRQRQGQSAQQIAEVVGDDPEEQSHLVSPEPMTGEARPMGRGFTFLDPLLRRRALVVEADDGPVCSGHRSNDEAHPRKEFSEVMLDLAITRRGRSQDATRY